MAKKKQNPTLLQTDTKNFQQLMGADYEIPHFQRDYSWDIERWEDLWEDLEYMLKNNEAHYMGAIVLQEEYNKFIVLDGQQRIVTLSVLVLAVISMLKTLSLEEEPDQNKQRAEILRTLYIGSVDAASLKYSSRVKLNDNNDYFYQKNLVNLDIPSSKKRLNDSEKLLLGCFEYFKKNVEIKFGSNKKGEELAQYVRNISRDLKFITITVLDELSAYTVFETLNARGTELTPTDLLKNYLLSRMQSKTDLDTAQRQWLKISEQATLKDFPNFLRSYWNGRQTLVRKEKLFKALKKQVSIPKQVFELLDNLEKDVAIYSGLQNPLDESWNLKQRKHVDIINLFNVKQPIPLLMVAHRKYNENDYEKLLNAIVIISFRYNIVCGKNPNDLERLYNTVSGELFLSSQIKVTDLIRSHPKTLLNRITMQPS